MSENKEKTINNLMGFLMRADLKGHEVPAFNECLALIQELKKADEE